MPAADLQPMAVAPRAPGEYAPAAGVRAVERLQDAAAPLRGARVLHVSVAGAEGRVPELLGGLLPLAAGAGVEVEWRVLFGSPQLRATAAALQSGLRGGESGIEEEAWAAYLEACALTARSLRDDYDAIVLHDAALGLAATLEAPTVWRLHEDASDAEPDALARAMELAERCSSVLVPHDRSSPAGRGLSRRVANGNLHVGAARHRPARPAQPAARAAAARPGGAAARRGSRPAVLPPGARARPVGRPARRDRRVPARPGGGARPSARAGRDPRPRRHRELAGGQGDLGLRRGHGRRAPAHDVRGARQPRGGRAPAARARGDRALAPRGVRPRPVRGALEADAGGGRRCRSRSATAWTASSRRTPRRRPRTSWSWCATPASPRRWAAPAASASASTSS